jgi:hypothetical protein
MHKYVDAIAEKVRLVGTAQWGSRLGISRINCAASVAGLLVCALLAPANSYAQADAQINHIHTFKCAFGPNDDFPGFYTFDFNTHVVSYYGGGAPGGASDANSAARSTFIFDGNTSITWSDGQINYTFDVKHLVFTELFTQQGAAVTTSCEMQYEMQ